MKKKLILRIVLIAAGCLVLAAAVWLGARYYTISRTRETTVEYDPGAWLRIAPAGLVSADGEATYGMLRVGSENKVIVLFYGGGLSTNAYTAARPYLGASVTADPGFYAADVEYAVPSLCAVGLGDAGEENPFRDWTLIVLPYDTADFHIGTGEYVYTAPDGSERTLYHHGYINYRAIMDEAVKYAGTPESLLIAGWSAGGFGAAMLARELMEDYFPDTEDVTVCVDSSLMRLDDWAAVARGVWSAPEALVGEMASDDLIVDFLGALYNEYGGRVKYLYIGSVRDGALARYQNYFDTGAYLVDNWTVRRYEDELRDLVERLRERVPTVGIYLFDRLPYSIWPWQSILTQHTLLSTRMLFWPLTDGVSAAGWLSDAVEGRVVSRGLALLGRWD